MMKKDDRQSVTFGTFFKWLARLLVYFVIILAVLLLAAGKIDYWEAWLYTGLNAIILTATFVVLRHKTDLMRERVKPGAGIKSWDRLYTVFSAVMYAVMLVLSGLDAGRFHWTGQMPLAVSVAGYIVYIFGQAVFLWAKYENRFLSSVVRIQKERGHTVCSTGPYRFVRHPSYIAGILFSMVSPLILGSLWALIPQAAACAALVVRTHLEDVTLKKELEGYSEYAKKVKYRLIPLIW